MDKIVLTREQIVHALGEAALAVLEAQQAPGEIRHLRAVGDVTNEER
ncbi:MULTISPECIES: hypothetical protein [unclassified Nocardioides]|nr:MULTISPECIES: hypothetical protein [unclassified Nocardioides]